MIRRKAFWDSALLLVIFIGGQQIGSRYVSLYQETAKGDFYQSEFGAAVALACGHGFRNPETKIPALDSFLLLKTNEFSCDRFPSGALFGEPTFMQANHRYLMSAVAWQWKWSGVSWTKMTPFFGVMFALTLCAAYGLFRMAGGPIVGLLGVVPLVVSAHQLAYLPQLRDYAKAPFFLLLILLIAQLAVPPLRPRRILLVAAVSGLVLGLGYGFRIDLYICIPPFIAAMIWLVPGRVRDNIRLKLAAAVLFAVMFIATAWPILSAFHAQGSTAHLAVLGLMSSFDEPLAVTRPVYDLGEKYLDGYAAAVITAYSYNHTGNFVSYLTPQYDAAGMALIKDVARHWPADIFIRGIASVLEVLDFPFTAGQKSLAVPYGVKPPWSSIYRWQVMIVKMLAGLGPVLAALSIVIIGSREVRWGVALALLLMYFGGYPAVQFHIRHFFHLEFIVWWALAFLTAGTARGIWRVATTRKWQPPSLAVLKNAAITAAVLVLAVVIPSATLRAYQQRHVTSLVESYLQLPRTPLTLSRNAAGDQTLVAVDDLWKNRNPAEPMSVRYLVAEFTAQGCGAANLPVTLKYDARASDADYGYLSRLAMSIEGPSFRVVPAYYQAPYSHFAGFLIPRGYDGCLKSVSRIDDVRRIPVFVDLTLPPRWRTASLFQRLAKWESDSDTGQTMVRTVPAEEVEQTEPQLSILARVAADEVAPGVAVNSSAHSWFTGEPVRVPDSHRLLLHFPLQVIEHGGTLRVRGTMRRGGLRIGTVFRDRLIDSRAVTSPGPFTVLIAAPEPGAYAVRITDEAAAEWRREPSSLLRRAVSLVAPGLLVDDFELTDVAWIRP